MHWSKLSVKTSLLLLLLLSFIFALKKDSHAQLEKIKLYAGASYASLATADFENFDISDWERYGLKVQDPNSLEGRVRLPLKDDDISSMNPGLMAGLIYPLNERLGVVAEIQYSSNEKFFKAIKSFKAENFKLIGGFLGVNYNLVNSKNFILSITPKAGYLIGDVDFGEIELIENYVPPVIIDQGSFTNGDTLSMNLEGIAVQIGITPGYKFTKKFGIQAHIGYALSFPRECKVKVNDGKIKLKIDDPAIVNPDGWNTQAGIDPEATSQGFYFQVGVFYVL